MPSVGVVGAGTMGAGIAQVAAAAGWNVELFDSAPEVAQRAAEGISKRLDRMVEKGAIEKRARDEIVARLHPATTSAPLRNCDMIVEAIVEDLAAKIRALADVARDARQETIFASNTSSLSIAKIGEGLGRPRRTVGMHFFNPVPLMPLVEVISSPQSDRACVERVAAIAREWGKTPVMAKDTPGFIVNRIARGYYLEPLRMLSEGVAGIDEIDAVMKTLGGFRMGPFELMDLVGIDVNYTVSCSVYEQLGRPARLKPHPIQTKLFEKKRFGRKSKEGFYSYQPEHPIPAVPVTRKSFKLPDDVYKAVRLFCEGATESGGSITEQYIFARTIVAVINEAALALDERVASRLDIDTAMKLGTNYPHGPLEWAEDIGRHTCRHLLDALNEHADDERFASAAWLRE